MIIVNRRKFLQQSALATGAMLLGKHSNAFAEEKSLLTVLHTNDVHSHLDPFPQDGSKLAGLGGAAERAEVIQNIRNTNDNVLLLDAGDIFQGTPYFNFYKGEPDIKAMSKMGYDACTIGNHDFDAGVENLALQLHHANFPMIVSNYDFTDTPMEGKTMPYKIFNKKNIKVGVFGLGIELKGLVSDELYGKTKYHEPVQRANLTADYLKKQGCEFIICLSHLGDWYRDNKVSDEILAKESFDLDLVVGGHTHRFFEEPKVYRNRKGGQTVVNQVGWAGVHLGRLDYDFSGVKKKNLVESHTVIIAKKTSE